MTPAREGGVLIDYEDPEVRRSFVEANRKQVSSAPCLP
jgi:hypothetical protein